MKRNLIMISAAAFMAAACSNSNTSHLEGDIEGVEGRSIAVSVSNLNLMGREFSDTLQLGPDGKFSYTLEDGNYRDVMISLLQTPEEKEQKVKKLYFQIVMLPGEKVTVTGTMENPVITSDGFYAEKAAVAEMTKDLDDELAQARVQFAERERNGEDKSALNAEFQEYFKTWRAKHDSIAVEYIKANPKSNYAYYMVASFNEPLKSEAMELLSEEVKQGPVKTFDEALAGIKKMADERQKALARAREKLAPGMQAPDFTLNDLNGNPLALSSLQGKYVVLDFWGSWCSWCIKGMPKMKEYYKKYSRKMEILGIACGDSPASWKKAVEENSLPWKNVINDEKGGTDASGIYAVSGYPTKVVIDPQGKIVKFVTGESEEFYEFLDSLFKK